MDPLALGAVAGSVSVALAFAIFRQLLPISSAAGSSRSLESLRSEYSRWELFTVLLLFVFAPAATFLLWKGFLLLFGVPEPFSKVGEAFHLMPAPVVWLFPAMALGLLASLPPVELVLRWLLGSRYLEFAYYQSLRLGFRTEALEKPLVFGLALVGAVLAACIANWQIVFSPVDVRWHRFWALREEVLLYTDVLAIKTAPKFVAPAGREVRRRESVIQFRSAGSWSTLREPSEATDEQLNELLAAVSRWSGIPIQEVPILTRNDLR